MSTSRNTPRKTIDVDFVLQRANAYLRLTPDENTESRKAIASLLESVLMEANVYQGFGYIKSTFDENGIYQSNEPTRYERGVTDETRVQYYRHRKLGR